MVYKSTFGMADAPRFRPGAPRARRDPKGLVLALAALAVGAYVVVYPFTRCRYPPLTDLPFHAAQASILRHYFDPAFHFREQFTVHPLEVPYVSMYAVGALFAFVVPIATAAKVMAIVMLALVPAGLAVLLHGMRKDPLWSVLGLGLTWCTISQWGFLSYMGATGLFAMAVGLALRVVDEPTRRRQLAFGACLVAIFFTHVYRFPFAVAGSLLAGALVYPATRRFSVLVAPLAPGVALFILWLFIRPHALAPRFGPLAFHAERFGYVREHLFGAYLPFESLPPTTESIAEHAIAGRLFAVAAVAVAAAWLLRRAETRTAAAPDTRTPEAIAADAAWARGVARLPWAIAATLFLLYLTLPLEVGQWFYVYPREIVGVVLFLAATVPELPRRFAPRAAVLALLGLTVVPMARFVSARFSEFEHETRDFRDVVAAMPEAPRLFYLIYWFGGSAKRASPFLHLPAWIQAEKGGSLAFHFAEWGFYPVRYREGSPAVPPTLEERFEWTPQYFDVRKHGPWFETFLVRHLIDPHELFDSDRSIHRVGHYGTWWLYQRRRP
jgi:hypothetical protein